MGDSISDGELLDGTGVSDTQPTDLGQTTAEIDADTTEHCNETLESPAHPNQYPQMEDSDESPDYAPVDGWNVDEVATRLLEDRHAIMDLAMDQPLLSRRLDKMFAVIQTLHDKSIAYKQENIPLMSNQISSPYNVMNETKTMTVKARLRRLEDFVFGKASRTRRYSRNLRRENRARGRSARHDDEDFEYSDRKLDPMSSNRANCLISYDQYSGDENPLYEQSWDQSSGMDYNSEMAATSANFSSQSFANFTSQQSIVSYPGLEPMRIPPPMSAAGASMITHSQQQNSPIFESSSRDISYAEASSSTPLRETPYSNGHPTTSANSHPSPPSRSAPKIPPEITELIQCLSAAKSADERKSIVGELKKYPRIFDILSQADIAVPYQH